MRTILVDSGRENALLLLSLEVEIGLRDVSSRVLTLPHSGVQIQALIAMRQTLRLLVVEGVGLESRFFVDFFFFLDRVSKSLLPLSHHLMLPVQVLHDIAVLCLHLLSALLGICECFLRQDRSCFELLL